MRRMVIVYLAVQVVIPVTVLVARAMGSDWLRFGWAMFSTKP